MNKQQLIEIFEELLEDYEDSEQCVIGEFSINVRSDNESLQNTIADYRKRLLAALDC
jgi:hypothetical protein